MSLLPAELGVRNTFIDVSGAAELRWKRAASAPAVMCSEWHYEAQQGEQQQQQHEQGEAQAGTARQQRLGSQQYAEEAVPLQTQSVAKKARPDKRKRMVQDLMPQIDRLSRWIDVVNESIGVSKEIVRSLVDSVHDLEKRFGLSTGEPSRLSNDCQRTEASSAAGNVQDRRPVRFEMERIFQILQDRALDIQEENDRRRFLSIVQHLRKESVSYLQNAACSNATRALCEQRVPLYGIKFMRKISVTLGLHHQWQPVEKLLGLRCGHWVLCCGSPLCSSIPWSMCEAQQLATSREFKIVTNESDLHDSLAMADGVQFSLHADAQLSGMPVLALADREGAVCTLDPESLVAWFRLKTHHVKFVLLMACNTRKLAEKLVRKAGVPLVICWDSEVRDDVAALFSEAFWNAFTEVQNADGAYELARASLNNIKVSSGLLDNGTPARIPLYRLDHVATKDPMINGQLGGGKLKIVRAPMFPRGTGGVVAATTLVILHLMLVFMMMTTPRTLLRDVWPAWSLWRGGRPNRTHCNCPVDKLVQQIHYREVYARVVPDALGDRVAAISKNSFACLKQNVDGANVHDTANKTIWRLISECPEWPWRRVVESKITEAWILWRGLDGKGGPYWHAPNSYIDYQPSDKRYLAESV